MATMDVDARRQRHVLDRRNAHVGVRLETERQDGDDDERAQE